jgi:hypothetical protein
MLLHHMGIALLVELRVRKHKLVRTMTLEMEKSQLNSRLRVPVVSKAILLVQKKPLTVFVVQFAYSLRVVWPIVVDITFTNPAVNGVVGLLGIVTPNPVVVVIGVTIVNLVVTGVAMVTQTVLQLRMYHQLSNKCPGLAPCGVVNELKECDIFQIFGCEL